MDRPSVPRRAAALVVGIAAGAAAHTRVASFEPFLAVRVEKEMQGEHSAVYLIRVTARGGGSIDEIRVEPSAGPVHLVGGPSLTFSGLRSGQTWGFRAELDDPSSSRGAIRVFQRGRVAGTLDVALETRR